MLKTIALVALGLVLLLVALVAWLYARAILGTRRAYAALAARISPVTEALARGEAPSETLLMRYAEDRATRKVLWQVLEDAAGATGEYFVFRYRTHEPHWAAKHGWMAGVAGPYDTTGAKRFHGDGTFSRFEAFDSRTPEQHVAVVHEAVVGNPAAPVPGR